jgi:hypothetical protein
MTPSQLKKVKLQSNNGMLQPLGDIHIRQPFDDFNGILWIKAPPTTLVVVGLWKYSLPP